MARIEDWKVDEYVTWDEYSQFCNHGYEFVEKNRIRYKRVPEEYKCAFCNKPLSGNKHKVLYAEIAHESDERGSSTRYYNNPKDGSIAIKIGLTCAKAFEQAHAKQYGY